MVTNGGKKARKLLPCNKLKRFRPKDDTITLTSDTVMMAARSGEEDLVKCKPFKRRGGQVKRFKKGDRTLANLIEIKKALEDEKKAAIRVDTEASAVPLKATVLSKAANTPGTVASAQYAVVPDPPPPPPVVDTVVDIITASGRHTNRERAEKVRDYKRPRGVQEQDKGKGKGKSIIGKTKDKLRLAGLAIPETPARPVLQSMDFLPPKKKAQTTPPQRRRYAHLMAGQQGTNPP